MAVKKRPPLDLSQLANRTLTGMEAKALEGQVLLLHPDEIETPKQVRTVFRNIEALRATIDSDGQDSPVTVGPKNSRGKYPLYKGGRRHKAASLEPKILLKALIDPDAKPADKAILSQVIENEQHDDLLPHEKGRAYLDAKEAAKAEGKTLTNREIAQYTGKSDAFISMHIAIAAIPDSLVELIETDITRDADLLNSMRILHGTNKQLYDKLVVEAKEAGSLDRKAVREAVRSTKNRNEQDASGDPSKNQQASDGALQQAGTNSEAPESTSSQVQPVTATQTAVEGKGTGASSEESQLEKGGAEFSHAETSTQKPGNGAQPASNEGGAPASDLLDKGAQKKTTLVSPADLMIFVEVAFDQDVRSGLLMIDRVCPDASKLWVNLVDGNGNQSPKLVQADQVQIVSISKRS